MLPGMGLPARVCPATSPETGRSPTPHPARSPWPPVVVPEAERQLCTGTLPARAWPRLPSLCVLDLAITVFWALRTGAGTQELLSRCLMSKYIQVSSSRAEAKLFT